MPPSGPLDHVQLKLLDSVDSAMEFKRWLGERRQVLGVDTETSGFSIEMEKLRLVQFGDLDTGWAIPWEGWGGVALEALREYEGDLVLHNSKFDARFIQHHGKVPWKWHRNNDTMAMAHILDPLRPKGLKSLAGSLIDGKAAASQKLLDEGMSREKWTWATVPVDFPLYWLYGALDPVLTCHLYQRFLPEIQNGTGYRDVYELELGTTRVIAAMEATGARIDRSYAELKRSELLDYANQTQDWIRANYGIEATDVQLMRWFERNGIPLLDKRTKGGRQSFDKEVLGLVDHPLADVVLSLRKSIKTANTYFKGLLDNADGEFVHANIWTMGARTARMSIERPSLQNQPRKDPMVRTTFIPRDGNVLITCDYDQVEARLAAHFSGDQGMLDAFGKDEDFFCALAPGIFGESIAKADPRRDLIKGVVYGKLFGAGPATMARSAKVAVETMEHVNALFDHAFPGIRLLQQSINGVAKQRKYAEGVPYVNTPTGRRMVADDNREFTLTNYLIQCHASEILKRKLLELDAVLPAGIMILPVHDEVVFDVPADIADDVRRTIEETMCDLTTYKVPITASSDLLTGNWGDKYRKKAA